MSHKESEKGVWISEAMLELIEEGLDLGVSEFGDTPKGEVCKEGFFALQKLEIGERMAAIAGEGIDVIKLANRGKRLVDIKQLEEIVPLDERLTRSIDLIEEMQNDPLHDPALKFVKETIQLVGARVKSMDAIVPQSLRQIAQRLRSRTGTMVTMSEVIDTIEALPDSLQRHRDLVGRGQTTPQVTYDPVVNEVRQCIENLQAAQGYLIQADMPDNLGEVIDYMQAHLKWLTEVQYSRKPVLDLKKIAEIMRDWIEEESLAAHVKLDMSNMVESLDKIIAQHIGEDIPVVAKEEGDLTSQTRIGWAMDVVGSAMIAHPLDIDQSKLKELLEWLTSVMLNNEGWHNLGKEGYILVPSSANLPGVVVDAVRGFLISYGQGEHMASELRSQSRIASPVAMANLPEWFATTYGHTSKGGFAALMYHVMTTVAAQDKPKAVHIGSAKLGELEEAIRNGVPYALVDFVQYAEKKDPRK